jgi:NTE family protein
VGSHNVPMQKTPTRRRTPPPIDLALQGGGSHGAFTWGVLDRLLEDGTLRIDGISGTSAGALNAAVLATGFVQGGAEGARAALRAFWLDVATGDECFGAAAPASPFASMAGIASYNLDANPFYNAFSQWLKLFSPQQLNPLGLDPLRDVVERHVSVAALREGPIRLFVTATAVTTGQPEVFMGDKLSHEALLASACLPQLFRAVQIDGVPYWDGGYSGNPAIWPLIYNTAATDVVLVKINPLLRPGVPESMLEIADRVNEITFNAGLVSELRAIRFVRELLKEERIEKRRYKSLRLHMVADDEGLQPLHPSSKMNTDRNFLLALHELGRKAADGWLRGDGKKVGHASSLDIEKTFLAPRRPGSTV